MPGHDPWATQRTRVRQRSGYLRNPLPAGPGVCYICRGPANPPHTRCVQCEKHFRAANGQTADVVVPISYAIKREQHAFNLASYKRRPGSDTVRADLLALVQVFIADHGRCLLNAARVSTFDGAVVVPSTRNRPGPHPLQLLITMPPQGRDKGISGDVGTAGHHRAPHEDEESCLPNGSHEA